MPSAVAGVLVLALVALPHGVDAEAVGVIAADGVQLRRASGLVVGASMAWATDADAERPPHVLAAAQAVQDALLPAALAWLESAEGTGVERTAMSLFLLAVGVVRRTQAEQAFDKKQRSAAARYAAEAVEHLYAVAQERKNDNRIVNAYHELLRWASREALVKNAQIVPRDKLDFGNRARWKRNLRSALNKNHRKADGYEVIGEMDNGLSARVRRWYVKYPARRTTIGITLTVLAIETEGRVTDATALDAEIEAILESIEIIPRD